MAFTTATWLAISAVTTVVGAGVSAYSSYQAGKTQEYMANLNAAQQERNARTQLLAMQTQAHLQQREAEANFALRSAEAQARLNNAKSMENQALGQDRINRVNLRKRAEEMRTMQAQQRAGIAASGLVESTGTPLDILAETAGMIQLDQEEQAYQFELNRRTIFREAEMERLGGRLALAGATLDRSSGIAAAGLQRASAEASFRAGLREAEITRIGGAFDRRAGTIGAAATLFSGLGQAGTQYFRTS